MSESKRPTFWERVVCFLSCAHRPRWRLDDYVNIASAKSRGYEDPPVGAQYLTCLPSYHCARCGHEW